MKAAKPWMTLILLGGMLAAVGCEENGGAGQVGGDSPNVLAASRNGSSASAAPEFSLRPAAGEPALEAINSPSGGNLLTAEEAISSVKQLHGHYGEVKWSAELQRGADYEGEKRDIWRVEALFPAGNRWWYSLDAADGKLLVLTELEAPLAEQDTVAPFKPYLTETENGLRLTWDDTLHRDVTIMQTLESPEANKLAVHLVRRLAYVKGRERFLMDAVIVDPAGKELRTAPLADALMNDGMESYTAGSFAQAFGFGEGERMIAAVPVKRPEGLQYDVLSLDIRTGKTSLLVQNVIPDPNPDWLAKGWLSSTGDKLVLNLYQSGELWAANLHTGQVQKSSASFPHLWPLINIYPSPDGDRFIYLGKKGDLGLYSAEGKQLAQLPGKEGVYGTPPAAWSPDGRFFALETTPGNTEEDVIWRGENRIYAIAPKQVLFFNRDGTQEADIQAEPYKPGGRIEFAGWLADASAAVLHAYKLEERREDVPERGQSAYYLTKSGQAGPLIPLAKAERIEDMEHPEAIFAKNDGRLVFVDRVSRLYWAQGGDYSEAHNEQGMMMFLVSTPGQEPLRWATSEGQSSILYSYSPSSRKTVQTRLPGNGFDQMPIGPDIVYDSAEGYLHVKMP